MRGSQLQRQSNTSQTTRKFTITAMPRQFATLPNKEIESWQQCNRHYQVWYSGQRYQFATPPSNWIFNKLFITTTKLGTIGGWLHQLQRYEEAIELCDKAIQIKRNNHQVCNRGNVVTTCWSAITFYNRAVRYKPDHYEALRTAEVMHYLIWKDIRGDRPYDRALRFKPDYRKAMEARNQAQRVRVRSAKLWRRKEDWPSVVLELVWNATLTAGSSKCFPMPRLMQLLCEMTLFDL